MSKTTHTPGPWNSAGVHVEDQHHHRCIADCQPKHESRVGSVEALRHACLIAAAPDLLDALRALADEFDRYDKAMTALGRGHEDYGRQREAARMAIAKAEGR